jgi:Zn-dependent protease with chaperone function
VRSASRLYRLHLSIGAVGAAGILAAGVSVLAGTSLSVPSGAAVAEACDSWLRAGGAAAMFGLALLALAATVLGLGLRSARRQIRASRRYLASLPMAGETLIQGTACRTIDTRDAQAFCAGYLRPRIYLTRGALDQLSPAELRAVLAHERHHLRRRDPLRRVLARTVADALFFIPVLRRISERYAELGELAADEAAVATLRDRRPLASALLKFSERDPAPAAVAGIDPERVDYLLGDPRAGRWQLPASLLSRSALALAGLGALVLLTWHRVLNPTLELPVLLAATCMAAMVGGPLAAAAAVVVISKRALKARRA